MKFVNDNGKQVVSPIRRAMLWAVVQQAIIFLMAGFILDGGLLMQLFGYGIGAFWGAVLVLSLRGKKPTKFDIAFIRSGTLPVCFFSSILILGIWHLRGF